LQEGGRLGIPGERDVLFRDLLSESPQDRLGEGKGNLGLGIPGLQKFVKAADAVAPEERRKSVERLASKVRRFA